jgi:hypothetical protein
MGELMAAPRIIAEVHDYQGLVCALRARINELAVRAEDIDALAGLPQRYCSKLLCPRAVRNLGKTSLGLLLATLGLKLQVVLDEGGVFQQVRSRLVSVKRTNRLMQTEGKRRQRRGFRFDGVTGRLARARGVLMLSRRRRRWIARNAARCRWSRNGASQRSEAPPVR